MELSLITNGGIVPLLIEEHAYEGVRRIGETVASDMELVTGRRPRIITEEALDQECVILCATLGMSSLLDSLAEDRMRERKEPGRESPWLGIEGKREVYKIFFAEKPFPGVKRALVICGSDKRGTIYGMFALSEYLGVTPLVYWGDSAPRRQENPVIREDICTVSKEPSVYYRGFFINDEWPCFGSWVTESFGGFNTKAYRHVFEFLLRMRGNYLWPAMWTASFPLDGPGEANEELADIYGVIMGYSHHEPCLRASEEWDKVRGEDSPYGNEWNFYTNRQGLLRYWEDALKRSGKYENVITIGMRGERDSSMLGEDATVAENVALLKDIIREQRQLICRHVSSDLSETPQMLALYKEVEAYFYGDETVAGLKDWDELEDVICMLCEDNFGHMRTLPAEEIRNHPGGFGMYYHLDYHGGPVSYEWIDSTPLSKIWEQMCMAYEYGIRRLWIVNAGDVKFHEVPLTYFMNLAYDYEKWGVSNPRSAAEFTEKWAGKNFEGTDCFGEEERIGAAKGGLWKEIAEVFTEYVDLLSLRRPEALNERIYHPCHYLEADRMLERVLTVEKKSDAIFAELGGDEKKAYYSMVHYPVMAGMNLLKMHLYAGKNNHYAGQGRIIANEYGRLAEECIARDLALTEEFGYFEGGKWNGMQLAPHIGFTKWNEDGCRYPVICRVTPVKKPTLSVSRKDRMEVCHKNYDAPEVIRIDDFLSAGADSVILELANDGEGMLRCRMLPEKGELPEWLEFRQSAEDASADRGDKCPWEFELAGGSARAHREVAVCCLRRKLPRGISGQRLLVTDGDTVVAVEVSAQNIDTENLPPMTFLSEDDVVVIDAKHFAGKKDVGEAGFRTLENYGKYGSGVKVFPVTADFGEAAECKESVSEQCLSVPRTHSASQRLICAQCSNASGERPQLMYRFLLGHSGVYRVELLAAPTNPILPGSAVSFQVSVEGVGGKTVELVSKDFRAGDHRDHDWCRGVLDQVRIGAALFEMEAGLQQLTIGAVEAGPVLERIRIYPADRQLSESYFGPEESFCSRKK